MSTPDIARSLAFLVGGLGLRELDMALHCDEHEALWGLAGAQCERRVLGGPTLLLEVVEYRQPRGQSWRPGYRICDQGILNICFGDPLSRHGVNAMHRRALAAGARQSSRPIHLPQAGCVYVNDPLGFSYEFQWAAPGRGHRDYGFTVLPIEKRPSPDNQRAEASVVLAITPGQAFELLTNNAALSQWSSLGRFAPAAASGTSARGLGAERLVTSTIGTVREQITDWQPGRRLRYRILEGSLLVNYQGEITLAPEADGTRVTWSARFRSRIPGFGGVFRRVLQGKLERALAGLQRDLQATRVPVHDS